MAPLVCPHALLGLGRATSQDEKAAGPWDPTATGQSLTHFLKTPELKAPEQSSIQEPGDALASFPVLETGDF